MKTSFANSSSIYKVGLFVRMFKITSLVLSLGIAGICWDLITGSYRFR